MSKTKHTPEKPCPTCGCDLPDCAEIMRREHAIVCTSALAGMDPGKLGELVEATTEFVELFDPTFDPGLRRESIPEILPRLRTALSALTMEGSTMPKAESTAKHTPWTVDPGQTSIRAGRNLVTTVCGDFTLARDVEHAARIVADHNVLAGMDPSKVAGLVEAAREAADILGEMDQYPTLRTALAALTMEGSK